jgi:hypothetical protein
LFHSVFLEIVLLDIDTECVCKFVEILSYKRPTNDTSTQPGAGKSLDGPGTESEQRFTIKALRVESGLLYTEALSHSGASRRFQDA